MNDLPSGEIAVGFVNITAQVVALHRGGKIRILAVNAPARLKAVPDIPTTAEAGLPNFVSQTFFGVFAAAGTPKAVLEKVNQVIQSRFGATSTSRKGSSSRNLSRCSASGPTRPRSTSAKKSPAGPPSSKRSGPRRSHNMRISLLSFGKRDHAE